MYNLIGFSKGNGNMYALNKYFQVHVLYAYHQNGLNKTSES